MSDGVASGTCEIYKKCSGCQLMNLSYPEQLSLKQSEIIKLFGRYCHVSDIVGMDDPYHYRNKATRAYRLRYPNKRIISGIYQSTTGAVIPCDDCLLEDRTSAKIFKEIRKLMPKYKLLPFDEKSRRGTLCHVMIRKAAKTGEYMVVMVTATPIFPKGAEFAKELCEIFPQIKTVVQSIGDTGGRIALGDREKVLLGNGRITDELMGLKFSISSASFYQINPVQTEKLYAAAIEAASLTGKERVLDCYCGIGTIGMSAAGYCKEVIGVESNPAAVKDAAKNAKLNKIENARFIASDTGEFLEDFLKYGEKADVVFLDPARAGCDKKVLNALCGMMPDRIVYISCNPETQARDVTELAKSGYRIKKVIPVDMFPFTRHVENIILLTVSAKERK